MAHFKCKQSGNVFEFKLDHDIKTMRTHAAYEEVVQEVVKEEPPKRTLGRPKKD
jgi:Fe2+ or Zn2+ uptake regulation protein